jgi:hypothetical protein
MGKLFFLFVCCGLYQYSIGQEKGLATSQNKRLDQREIKKFQSTQEVADFILSKYSTETGRIQGIYSWVTNNIRYDKTGTFAMNAGPDKQAKIEVAFKNRRGVCENFAAIFNDICQKSGFQSFMIEGITRVNNQLVDGAHTWVTVRVNEEWYFFDPTWDEGGRSNYFMVTPEEFISTHIPFDPLWQFLPTSANTGMNKTENKSHQSSEFTNYKDSLAAWMQLDSISKLEATERRILNAGINNRNVKTNLSVVKMNLEIERQGEQVEWHEMATKDLNEAVEKINQFIEIRNDLSLLQKPDEELKKMLADSRSKIDRAVTYLDKIDQSKEKLVMGTWPERERIVSLKSKLESQETFLNQYIKTAIAERRALFYK